MAFPGGKHDATDASLLHTALRETQEEVSIPLSMVDVLGALDDFVTVTGYVITPFVGWLSGAVDPVPNPAEVARVFAAPLRRFLVTPDATVPPVPGAGYTVDGEFVWGATAALARRLGAIVTALETSSPTE